MPTVFYFPSAAGDETNIPTLVGAATNWEAVDDNDGTNPLSDGNTTRIENATASWTRDLYQTAPLSGQPSAQGAIVGIDVFATFKSSSSASNRVKACVKTNSVVTEGATIGTTTSWAEVGWQWLLNPTTGLAWTLAEIEALQIGINILGNGVTTGVTLIYVRIEYVGVTYPTDTLLRVSGIVRTFWAGIGGQGVYQTQLVEGGLSTTYVSPISSREVQGVIPRTTPTPAGAGFQPADYEKWLIANDLDVILKFFGHFPSYQDWLNNVWRLPSK